MQLMTLPLRSRFSLGLMAMGVLCFVQTAAALPSMNILYESDNCHFSDGRITAAFVITFAIVFSRPGRDAQTCGVM